MRYATSFIVVCLLILVVTNHVNGQGKTKCLAKLEGYGSCGPNGSKLCLNELEQDPKHSKFSKVANGCECQDRGKRKEFNMGLSHSCVCYSSRSCEGPINGIGSSQ
ncbi:hypothetical protein ISN44_As08g035050 [Arabidopsis suecica]|uniref:Uncharacterized protein n=1 Tax=Arabidopsis suecica TaxID=45249 RepID=A0A8T2BEW4_ARASU|nr:hypothetical protein ISN44_As08g035050 [Arabidopsis suecica]